MAKKKFTLKRNECLKSRKQIKNLFLQGAVIKKYPVKLLWSVCEEDLEDVQETTIKVGFSVPKRRVKYAVDRNKIKRQLREIYRLNNKEVLKTLNEKNMQINCMFIFNSSNKYSYQNIEKSALHILNVLNTNLKNNY